MTHSDHSGQHYEGEQGAITWDELVYEMTRGEVTSETRVEKLLEKLVATISDLTTVVAAQQQQISDLINAITALLNKPSSTTLSADDQAALDASVTQNSASLASETQALANVVNPPAPAPVEEPQP